MRYHEIMEAAGTLREGAGPDILVDPTLEELRRFGLQSRLKEVKGIVYDGHVYVCDAYDLNHVDLARKVSGQQIPPQKYGSFYVWCGGKAHPDHDLTTDENGESLEFWPEWHDPDYFGQNIAIQLGSAEASVGPMKRILSRLKFVTEGAETLREGAATPAEQFVAAVASYPQDMVSIHVRVVSPAMVSLEQIWSEIERGKGHASSALCFMTDLADRLDVTIKLVPHWLAYDDDAEEDDTESWRLHDLNQQRLDNEQLMAWYARYGFVPTGEYDGDDPVMIRHPRSGIVEAAEILDWLK